MFILIVFIIIFIYSFLFKQERINISRTQIQNLNQVLLFENDTSPINSNSNINNNLLYLD